MTSPPPPSLSELLLEVWKQTLVEARTRVEVGGGSASVGRTRAQGLRTVAFTFGAFQVEGIEQNPTTTSRWAKLALEGKRIMQFRCGGTYVANVCEGSLNRYPAWKARGLPD